MTDIQQARANTLIFMSMCVGCLGGTLATVIMGAPIWVSMAGVGVALINLRLAAVNYFKAWRQ